MRKEIALIFLCVVCLAVNSSSAFGLKLDKKNMSNEKIHNGTWVNMSNSIIQNKVGNPSITSFNAIANIQNHTPNHISSFSQNHGQNNNQSTNQGKNQSASQNVAHSIVPNITPSNTPNYTPKPISNDVQIIKPFFREASYKGVKMLMYHCVSDTISGEKNLFVSPSEFDKQMKFLKENGYTTISVSDLARAGQLKKAVLITFDDGYENNYTDAYPIIKKYGLKATIFAVANFIGKKEYLSESSIQAMKNVMDIEDHTLVHDDLQKIPIDDLEKTILASKQRLEKLLDRKITAIAYPYGSYNMTVLQIVKKYYSFGFSVNDVYSKSIEDAPYQITRFGVGRETTFNYFKSFFIPGTV